MDILTTYFTASHLFKFVREGMMYVEFNSVTLFTVPYSRFLNCAKDVSKVTAQPTILKCTIIDYPLQLISISETHLQSDQTVSVYPA